jgi:hypothetical protein
MRWLKHMTSSWDDEKLARLVGAGGMQGLAHYGLYWRINEIIASQMEGKSPSCSVCYPVSVWSRLLVTRGSLVFSTLSTLAVTHLVTVERDGDDIRVTNRNLLKYRDEYSRKSGHTPDKVAPDTDTDTDTEAEGDSTKPIASSDKNRSLPQEQEPTIFELPLVDGTEYGVPQKLYDEYIKAYPGVTVMAQLSKMRTWLLSNPTRRKTRKGITRAINSWLSRAQDSSGRTGYLPLPEMEPRKPTYYEKDRDAFAEELQKRKQEMGVNYGG